MICLQKLYKDDVKKTLLSDKTVEFEMHDTQQWENICKIVDAEDKKLSNFNY